MDVLPVCGTIPRTLDYISVDRQVESESFSGCNIVVDGYRYMWHNIIMMGGCISLFSGKLHSRRDYFENDGCT